MSILDYFFLEKCRICAAPLGSGKSQALTLCNLCWLPLDNQQVQLSSISGQSKESSQLMVAHAVSYQENAKELIHKLKYKDDRLVARDLSRLLLKSYQKLQAELPGRANCALVPIPLFPWRKFRRGFNQSELLAKLIAGECKIPLKTNMLSRRRNTEVQHQLNKLERAANLRGAFDCTQEPKVDQTIILVDDILTSGSTLLEAAKVLRSNGASEVLAIAVARADLIAK